MEDRIALLSSIMEYNQIYYLEFAFWSRVEGNYSRVESTFERRQIKISYLLEFPVSIWFYINTWWYHVFFSLFQALVSWNKLTFVIDRFHVTSSLSKI